MPTPSISISPPCVYPQSNPTARDIRTELAGVVANKSKCSSFYLDTTQAQSSGGESHHQGLARTQRLSDGSIYFFLVHSNLPSFGPSLTMSPRGNLFQFRYVGPTDQDHIIESTPLTVAAMTQQVNLEEPHPSDIAFLPDVNNQDAGYVFVCEEYVEFRLSIYRWEPSEFLALQGRITQWYPQGGPNFVFIDKVGDYYYLGLANNNAGQVRVLRAECSQLFPTCRKGEMKVSAFTPLEPQSTFPFPISSKDAPSQAKLIRDSTGKWFLLGFRSDPDDDPHGTDYVDVYSVTFSPFAISSLLFSTHIDFKAGNTGFANTGTHYVEKSGRLLISSSYRWSENEGPGKSSYVSRVDESPSS